MEFQIVKGQDMKSPVCVLPGLSALLVLLLIGGCQRESASEAETDAGATPVVADADALAEATAEKATEVSDEAAAAVDEALLPSDDVPYPIYPNGTRYRVGGENGLKIVLFETADSFEEVDAFYSAQAEAQGMPRLHAMTDYVRFGSGADDQDAWATHRPGIVVHEFSGDEEREAVGADSQALTNIIISY